MERSTLGSKRRTRSASTRRLTRTGGTGSIEPDARELETTWPSTPATGSTFGQGGFTKDTPTPARSAPADGKTIDRAFAPCSFLAGHLVIPSGTWW